MRISDWSSDVCSSDLPPSVRPKRWRQRSYRVAGVAPRCTVLRAALGTNGETVRSTSLDRRLPTREHHHQSLIARREQTHDQIEQLGVRTDQHTALVAFDGLDHDARGTIGTGDEHLFEIALGALLVLARSEEPPV